MDRLMLLLVISFAAVGDCGVTNTHSFNLFKEMSERNMSWFKALAQLQEKIGDSDTDNVDINLQVLTPEDDELMDSIYWEDCTTYKDFAEVLSVSFDPDPPQKGEDFIVTTEIQLYDEVEGGKVYVNLKYLGVITVLKETWDLCSLASMSGDSCPLSTGVHENYIKEKFPSLSFSGQYTGTVKAVDSNDKEISCVKVKFSI